MGSGSGFGLAWGLAGWSALSPVLSPPHRQTPAVGSWTPPAFPESAARWAVAGCDVCLVVLRRPLSRQVTSQPHSGCSARRPSWDLSLGLWGNFLGQHQGPRPRWQPRGPAPALSGVAGSATPTLAQGRDWLVCLPCVPVSGMGGVSGGHVSLVLCVRACATSTPGLRHRCSSCGWWPGLGVVDSSREPGVRVLGGPRACPCLWL